jgi:hypothetical protein
MSALVAIYDQFFLFIIQTLTSISDTIWSPANIGTNNDIEHMITKRDYSWRINQTHLQGKTANADSEIKTNKLVAYVHLCIEFVLSL